MVLQDEDVKEFQALYEKDCGEPISETRARIVATQLITLYEALARPLSNEMGRFTDSIESGRLDLEVGNQSDEPPASEKVAL